MSALLTHHVAGPQAKTGTGNADFVNDLVSLVNSKSGDADFKWQIASSQNSNPFYVVLKRKDASNGRIMLICHSSAPAGANSAIYGGSPTANSWCITWFPNGNVDSPSNLSAASGTILGNDTGVVKASSMIAISTLYTTSVTLSWFDSEETFHLIAANPASVTTYSLHAGKIYVDAADNEYDGVFCTNATNPLSLFGSKTSSAAWQPPSVSMVYGQTGTMFFGTNYGAADRKFFQGMVPNSFLNNNPGSDEIMRNSATNQVSFFPINLIGQTKQVGFPLKLRQMAYGPSPTGPLEVHNESGPVTKAFSMQHTTSPAGASAQWPWLLNFKI
jgi:hypothetical protein